MPPSTSTFTCVHLEIVDRARLNQSSRRLRQPASSPAQQPNFDSACVQVDEPHCPRMQPPQREPTAMYFHHAPKGLQSNLPDFWADVSLGCRLYRDALLNVVERPAQSTIMRSCVSKLAVPRACRNAAGLLEDTNDDLLPLSAVHLLTLPHEREPLMSWACEQSCSTQLVQSLGESGGRENSGRLPGMSRSSLMALTICGRSSPTVLTPSKRKVVSTSWPSTNFVQGQAVLTHL